MCVVCVYMRVCVCAVCVCVLCACVNCAAILYMVGLAMHHRGLILCGVANGSSPIPSHVVETRQGHCKPTKGLPMHTLHAMHTQHAFRGPS